MSGYPGGVAGYRRQYFLFGRRTLPPPGRNTILYIKESIKMNEYSFDLQRFADSNVQTTGT